MNNLEALYGLQKEIIEQYSRDSGEDRKRTSQN